MPWFRELSAEDRSWVGDDRPGRHPRASSTGTARPRDQPAPAGDEMVASVFGAAPRALAGVINLQQTVDLVRLSIEVVEANIDEPARPRRRPPTCAPRCCATPARSRSRPPRSTPGPPRSAAPGTPGSRRWSSTRCCAPRPTRRCSRAPAPSAGPARGDVAVVLGSAYPADRSETDTFDEVRRVARAAGMDALCAVQGDRLVVLLGGVTEPRAAAAVVVDLFGAGPVVVGPVAERPRPGPRLRARRAGGAPGRARLARGAPPGAQRRPAARARPRRRRPRPPPPRRRDLPAAGSAPAAR